MSVENLTSCDRHRELESNYETKCSCKKPPPKNSPFRLPPRLVGVGLFVLLLTVISVAAYKKLSTDKVSQTTKGLEFQRIHKGYDEDDQYHQLKKSDPFMDGFVPKEYTDYLAKKPAELNDQKIGRSRKTRAVDSSDHYNEVPAANLIHEDTKKAQQQQETSTASNQEKSSETETGDDDIVIVDDDDLDIVEGDLNEEIEVLQKTNEVRHSQQVRMNPTTTITSNGQEPIITTTTTTTTTTTSTTTTTTETNPDDIDIEFLRAKVKFLESKMGLDPGKLMVLNKTLHEPQTRQLFLSLITKLEEKILGESTTTSTPSTTTTTQQPNGDLNALPIYDANGNEIDRKASILCNDITPYKILPQDTPQIVRKKQGHLMRCYMDESVDPCDRFYEYACGRWNGFHPIQKDRGGSDIFEILREDMEAKLIQMLESPIDENDNNSTAAVKALYSSCMNTEIIENRKETPLLKLLRQLGGWPVLDGDTWNEEGFNWQKTITKLREYNNDILVAVWIGPDGKDSDDYIVQLDQSDLLLPSAEYYLLGLGHPIMQTYNNLLVNVATLLGADRARAKKEMKELIEFEIELASIMIPPSERRNYSEIYHKLELGKLASDSPDFDFVSYLGSLLPRPLNSSEEVVVYALSYFNQLTKLMKNTPKRTAANYILWRFIRHRINNLDTRFLKAQQELYRRLYGREETPPRKKFCVAYVNGNLGNSVGALFVRKYFDEQSKGDMEALTMQVQHAFHDLVMVGGWLSNDTKKLAESKIRAIIHNIGYPDFILDDKALQEEFFGLTYQKDEFFENVLKNLRGRTLREMSQLDDRVNRTLWTTTPAVVNAYYSRNRNQIMFPAGILQPPFYHKYFPKSLNFGGIGVVIGHEITHGFDDKGRQFDHVGNINQWWDHISSLKFQDKAQCIIDQYNQMKVEEVGIYLNGLNTQGENIADNGGIKQSFHAYQNWLAENDLKTEGPLPGLEHLTDQQLFFLNFAQVWCGSTRPEALRSKVKTAVHAPGKYRVFGTLSNSEEFSRAFNCPRGNRMNPESKCSVW